MMGSCYFLASLWDWEEDRLGGREDKGKSPRGGQHNDLERTAAWIKVAMTKMSG